MEKRILRLHPATPDERVIAYHPPVSEEAAAAIKDSILAKLTLDAGQSPSEASNRDWFLAAALTARDRIVHHWAESKRRMRFGWRLDMDQC
jgi:glucan phosphorylase